MARRGIGPMSPKLSVSSIEFDLLYKLSQCLFIIYYVHLDGKVTIVTVNCNTLWAEENASISIFWYRLNPC